MLFGCVSSVPSHPVSPLLSSIELSSRPAALKFLNASCCLQRYIKVKSPDLRMSKSTRRSTSILEKSGAQDYRLSFHKSKPLYQKDFMQRIRNAGFQHCPDKLKPAEQGGVYLEARSQCEQMNVEYLWRQGGTRH